MGYGFAPESTDLLNYICVGRQVYFVPQQMNREVLVAALLNGVKETSQT